MGNILMVKVRYRLGSRGLLAKDNELKKLKIRKTTKRVSKLEPYKTLINEKLELGCTAMVFYKYIPKKGYEGKYTILREYCKNKKEKEIRKATI
ncbi:hypothetical protein [Staphylococcus delphini]|uniref:hypothetical protein n=1 Tax=Staphylococcus delphini TaxID=53344 RepID=UPI000BD0D1DF|nr:hypothetical protein [Staphylococcus delphini]PCF82847.1 hypothetical protein B4W69_11895 [Staphylococcus delphini]